jgi:hypothetical protein
MGEAKQLETQAAREVAVGTYNADIINQRAKQILSSQRAAAAAGGGDTTDATVQAITDETIKSASIEKLMQMANAEDTARQLRFEATTRRYAGATGLQQGRLNASAQKLATTAQTIMSVEKLGSDIASAFATGGMSTSSSNAAGHASQSRGKASGKPRRGGLGG